GDVSGERLEVATYNGGVLIARYETTTPRGIVEMHVSVGPAVTGPDLPLTPSPAETVPAPFAVPDTGVWVQVRYPGNYTGTISSNGQVRPVDGAGNQFYQMVMKSGTIDGTLEKADGSMDLLEILVYRDGVLTALANTTVPRGIAEVHTIL
ncbi:MAG TPA: hypothetical protein VHN82_05020, partial [Methanoregula sp.]|nr:hypothetical protein [Methanoregula sp.]